MTVRLVLALLFVFVLVGCESGGIPISPLPTPAVSSQTADAYRMTEISLEWNEDEVYVECQLRHDSRIVDERKWFQAPDVLEIRISWVVDGFQSGRYEVYCRVLHINGYYLYPFGDDRSDPDGWQFIESWYVPESHLFYLPVVWKRWRG